MTMEEMKKKKILSNTNGRPSSTLTDEQWQKEFTIRKLFITPYKRGKTKKFCGKYIREEKTWREETQGTYEGYTNWQSYSSFINDILSNIRAGQVDYCYYIYQISDLVRFHYNDLRTKYCDGYWEVWLEQEDNAGR